MNIKHIIFYVIIVNLQTKRMFMAIPDTNTVTQALDRLKNKKINKPVVKKKELPPMVEETETEATKKSPTKKKTSKKKDK